MAYEKYSSDGELKLRIPMKSASGCYSINNGEITATHKVSDPIKINYKISGSNLNIESPEGNSSYNLVPEGAWYESKKIDYQEPQNEDT